MRPTAPTFPRSTRRSSILSRPSGRRSEPLLKNATVVLSRPYGNGRRFGASLVVETGDSVRDGAGESVGVSKGAVGELMLLEIAPASFDIVQFGGVFRQPFEGEPGALGKRLCGQLAGVDWPVVENRDQRPSAFGGAVGGAELVEQGDKVGGTLGGAGMHEKLTQLRFSRHACLHSPHPRQTIHPIAHSYAVCLVAVPPAKRPALHSHGR